MAALVLLPLPSARNDAATAAGAMAAPKLKKLENRDSILSTPVCGCDGGCDLALDTICAGCGCDGGLAPKMAAAAMADDEVAAAGAAVAARMGN